MDNLLTVRPAADSDFAQWSILWEQYNEFYGRVGKSALPKDIVRSTWQRFSDSTEPVHCLVAEYNQKLVGLAHYIFHRNTITVEDTCYLQDLFSEPSIRGKGVGQALISGVYERAKKAGSSNIYWHTHSTNETAIKLYQKIAADTGFIVYRKSSQQ